MFVRDDLGGPVHWWNREFARQALAMPLIPVGLFLPGGSLLQILAGWDLYAVGYLLLTWLTFRGRDAEALRKTALAARRRIRGERWFATTPEQLSQGAAVIALFATVVALPRAESLGPSLRLTLVICIAAVVTSWVALQTGFVISYLVLHARQGGFEFPGDEEPVLIDFVYFAVSVGTTFGTTDVAVTHRLVRRQVIAHGILAFVFNTLVLATAVTFVTSYLAG